MDIIFNIKKNEEIIGSYGLDKINRDGEKVYAKTKNVRDCCLFTRREIDTIMGYISFFDIVLSDTKQEKKKIEEEIIENKEEDFA
jgi:hypothetical protein